MTRARPTMVAHLVLLLAIGLAACTPATPPAPGAPAAAPTGARPTAAAPSTPLAQAAQNSATPTAAAVARPPATVEELAMYAGADRQQLLETGAAKEGQLMFYTSLLDAARGPLVEAFSKKYPSIRVEAYRASNEDLVPRIVEEYRANRFAFDVLETSADSLGTLKEEGVMARYRSPEMAQYPPESVDPDGYFAPTRESYAGLGFNTNLLKKEEVPKNLDDLLDPRWKGHMAIAGSSTGVRFVGNVILTKGEDFLKKLGAQDIRVQKISGRALADLVVAGEVPLSPTIFDSHVDASKQKGAPIGWVPLEPTVVNNDVIGLALKSPHPHAALLFIDFVLSEAGQKVFLDTGYASARKGIGGTATEFKKRYLENDVKDYAREFDRWQKLMNATFIQS